MLDQYEAHQPWLGTAVTIVLFENGHKIDLQKKKKGSQNSYSKKMKTTRFHSLSLSHQKKKGFILCEVKYYERNNKAV